jgi:hypothetical protein
MSGVLFLAIIALVCIGDFLIGLWFVRMSARPLNELPAGVRASSPEQLARIGRLFMIAAPIFFLVMAAVCFGLFGPVGGITPIRFQ